MAWRGADASVSGIRHKWTFDELYSSFAIQGLDKKGGNNPTREELKEEYKQSDGDPHVKAKQRQIRAERSRRRMMQAVPTATVVVMNPTHYAVALRYEPGETAAPMCVGVGIALALNLYVLLTNR